MIHFFARFLSWVFLPLFVPLYGLLIVFYIPSSPSSYYLFDSLYHYPNPIKWLFLSLFLVFIVLAPGLSLIVLKVNRSISSLSLENRNERSTPIGIMFFYTIVLYLFLMMQSESSYVPNSIKAMVLGGAITTALAYFINKRNKISLHAIGMGSLLGFIYSYYLDCESFPLWVLYIIILLGALTASARLYLQLHNLKEILYGYIMSFIIQVSVIQFFTFYNEGYI